MTDNPKTNKFRHLSSISFFSWQWKKYLTSCNGKSSWPVHWKEVVYHLQGRSKQSLELSWAVLDQLHLTTCKGRSPTCNARSSWPAVEEVVDHQYWPAEMEEVVDWLRRKKYPAAMKHGWTEVKSSDHLKKLSCHLQYSWPSPIGPPNGRSSWPPAREEVLDLQGKTWSTVFSCCISWPAAMEEVVDLEEVFDQLQ